MTSRSPILIVAGTRPNFIKVAPLLHALRQHGGLPFRLVHSGQHHDENLFDIFFRELHIPPPDEVLEPFQGSTMERFGRIMVEMERLIQGMSPRLVFVVGDVDTTLAAALAAVKCKVPLAHLEAGLRSGDRRMPEEVNRIMTDAVADHLLSTGTRATSHLLAEGQPRERIVEVGNIMIDTLHRMQGAIDRSIVLKQLGLPPRGYALLTLHRPGNVDEVGPLSRLMEATATLSRQLPVLFPVHPRTRKMLEHFGLWEQLQLLPGLRLCGPLGYLDFGRLVRDARLVLTDSGGVQEETTVYGIP
ncbi:MAG TPA: UDP-N-acetylglucosamine 2-epimerase (non-hydrolyzing), partial [Bacteroidales bacterium]|nr:UDP-N-acetylglucosamine 2-epimerase (non-hydrolyzing) [Bacteroidales bacterium]